MLLEKIFPICVEKNRYEGFEPAVEKNKGDIQVTADGLAVKNIYYNRKTYTIKFYVSQRRDYFGNPTGLESRQ